MFHPEVVAANERRLLLQLGDVIPEGRLIRHSLDECQGRVAALAQAYDKKGNLLRPLTPAESQFILHERFLCFIDYQYWVERYAVVAKETQDAEPLTPLWASQVLFLSHLREMEYERHTGGHPDGVLVNILKARQLGISTMTETIVAHRATTQKTLRALIAADVQEQARYMMSMAELVIDNLPPWLRPPIRAHQRGDYWEAQVTNTTIRTAWGKSTRGGLQDQSKTKGNIGRGRTFGCVHLTEYSTWERPEQIKDGLMPGIPRRPRTFVAFESTAKGRYDAWHQQWLSTERGEGRFRNVFIPWYIEPDKYWLPAPEAWVPNEAAAQHAELVERTSGLYLLGRTVRLTREQLYWYERERAVFEADDNLYKFIEEYPATPEEAFQHAGRTIFKASVLERVAKQERAPIAVVEIQPAREIAQLAAWEREAKLTGLN
jgi:hypothetical protein